MVTFRFKLIKQHNVHQINTETNHYIEFFGLLETTRTTETKASISKNILKKHVSREDITFKNREQFLGIELSLIYATLLLLNASGTHSVSYWSTISTTYTSNTQQIINQRYMLH